MQLINNCMYLAKIHIRNFLTFENSVFTFSRYNVIVGPNNTGKTNLIRAMSSIWSAGLLTLFQINKNQKLDPIKPTIIEFTLNLSNDETRMIFQCIFGKMITKMDFPESVKTLDVRMIWNNTTKIESILDFVVYHFHSNFTIISNNNSEYNVGFPPCLKQIDYEHIIEFLETEGVGLRSKLTADYDNILYKSIDDKPKFIENVINCKQGEDIFLKQQILDFPLKVTHTLDNPSHESSEIAEYMKINVNHHFSLDALVSKIFHNNSVFVPENHPEYNKLTGKLVELRNSYPEQYQELQDAFKEITNNAQVMVKNTPSRNFEGHEDILFKEGDRETHIQNSASGYYALVSILHMLLNKSDNLVVIDEPENHFHPTMIQRLSAKLKNLTDKRKKQLIIITHSPKFVTYDILNVSGGSKLIIVSRPNVTSVNHSISDSFKPKLVPHLFNPDMFFGRCSMIVEGASDYFTLKAISDYHGRLFEKYDITLMYYTGKHNVYASIELHEELKIPGVAMIDDDANYKSKNIVQVVKLSGKLETELEKIGWKSNKKATHDVYDFTTEFLKNGERDVLFESGIGIAFSKIIELAGGTIPWYGQNEDSRNRLG